MFLSCAVRVQISDYFFEICPQYGAGPKFYTINTSEWNGHNSSPRGYSTRTINIFDKANKKHLENAEFNFTFNLNG